MPRTGPSATSRRSSGAFIRALPTAWRTRAALRTARSLVRADVSGIASDRQTASWDSVDRSARIALLRGSGNVYSSSMRLLRVGDCPRAASLRSPRRRAGERVPGRRRSQRLPAVGRWSWEREPISPPRPRDHRKATKSVAASGMCQPLAASRLLHRTGIQPAPRSRRLTVASSSCLSRTSATSSGCTGCRKRRRSCWPMNYAPAGLPAISRDDRARAFEDLHLPLTAIAEPRDGDQSRTAGRCQRSHRGTSRLSTERS